MAVFQFFFFQYQGLNSGPCTCQASTYSIELSPQPLEIEYYKPLEKRNRSSTMENPSQSWQISQHKSLNQEEFGVKYFMYWKKTTSIPDWCTLKSYQIQRWNKILSWQKGIEEIHDHQANPTKSADRYSKRRQKWSQLQEQQKQSWRYSLVD